MSSLTCRIRTDDPDPDMRCYNNILNSIPEENVTVPVIIHAIVEQVKFVCNLVTYFQSAMIIGISYS